jgi:hypothetical protein
MSRGDVAGSNAKPKQAFLARLTRSRTPVQSALMLATLMPAASTTAAQRCISEATRRDALVDVLTTGSRPCFSHAHADDHFACRHGRSLEPSGSNSATFLLRRNATLLKGPYNNNRVNEAYVNLQNLPIAALPCWTREQAPAPPWQPRHPSCWTTVPNALRVPRLPRAPSQRSRPPARETAPTKTPVMRPGCAHAGRVVLAPSSSSPFEKPERACHRVVGTGRCEVHPVLSRTFAIEASGRRLTNRDLRGDKAWRVPVSSTFIHRNASPADRPASTWKFHVIASFAHCCVCTRTRRLRHNSWGQRAVDRSRS